MTAPARTIFLGSGGFGVPIVARLAGHPAVDLLAVVSAPPRLGSRHRPTDPPVAAWAITAGLPLIRPERLRAPEAIESIAAHAPELLVLADYGQIVPQSLLALPRYGALNLHPSLLPRHRGASPIPAAILAGDEVTGVTLMVMDAGLDSGPLIAQREQLLDGTETAPELEARLAALAADLLADSLDPWLAGDLLAEPQPASGATLTRPLARADGRLDPSVPTATLERQVRAFQPWPGSFIETDLGRIVVWRTRGAGGRDVDPGTMLATEDGLALATGDGMLELLDVQPAGGRRMTGAELLRGRPSLADSAVVMSSASRSTD